MRILQVIPYFVPAYSYGGPLKACFDISRELSRRGHSVTVATTDTLDKRKRIKRKKEVIDGVQIIRFKNLNNRIAKKRNVYLPIGFYKWLKKNIQHYDIIHCHDFYTIQNIIVSKISSKSNTPYVIQPHGTLNPIRRKTKATFVKNIYIKLFSSILKKSEYIIALTKREKEHITSIDKKLERKIIIIPNGIMESEPNPTNPINLHQKYQIPENNTIIGFIGRLHYIKGIDISLQILSKIKDKLSFTYLIIGPDEGEQNNLTELTKILELDDKVIFTGELTGRDKLETIASCNFFLFPSRSEGLPMTILEIAALGLPQIISRQCNVPEIESYNAGFEVELSDHSSFAKRILRLSTDLKLRTSQGKNAKKMISLEFNLHAVCDQLESTAYKIKKPSTKDQVK